jgi:mRNA-degrading endonuclease RelE of RelBE toxin-antitoxin system
MEILVEGGPAYRHSYNKLSDYMVKDELEKIFDLMKADRISADKIEKSKWPKTYLKKYHINNLWRYEIKSYRLIYTIRIEKGIKRYGVLDILTHSQYDNLFGYHTS